MKTNEFEELLIHTVIPSNLGIAEQINLIKPLNNYILSNTPANLFKYRNCNERHISAFFKDQVWVSTADGMNDGFDTRIYYDRKAIKSELDTQMSEESVNAFIDDLRNNEELRRNFAGLPGGEEALQYLFLPEEYIKYGMEASKKKLIPLVDNELDIIYSASQQSIHFCSLSETVTSASMWGQYSDNEQGFCIEYSFNNQNNNYNLVNGEQVNCYAYPVIYKRDRFTVPSNYISYVVQKRLFLEDALNTAKSKGVSFDINEALKQIEEMLPCPDLLIATKIALHKSLEWQFEKEWRLFCNFINSASFNNSTFCFIKKPKALYLGRRISELNEKILKNLAHEKGIPVFKMKLNDNSPSYELLYDLL